MASHNPPSQRARRPIETIVSQQSPTPIHSEQGRGYLDSAIEYFNAGNQEELLSPSAFLQNDTTPQQDCAMGGEQTVLNLELVTIPHHNETNAQTQDDCPESSTTQDTRDDVPMRRIFHMVFDDWNDLNQRGTYKNALKLGLAAIKPFIKLNQRWSEMDRTAREAIVDKFITCFTQNLRYISHFKNNI